MKASLAPFGRRDFRYLFSGRVTSLLGTAIAPIALAFAVLDLTGSPTSLGLVLAARSIPQVVFMLVGGVIADRWPRQLVMVGANAVSGTAQATVALLLLLGLAEVWHLVALEIVAGASSAFFFPASSGIVPQTVPPRMLQEANALLRISMSTTTIFGAAVGGVLVAAIGSGWALAFDAATYFAAAVLLGRIAIPRAARTVGSNMLAELRDGWREFSSRTWLWAIVVAFGFMNAAYVGASNVLGPTIARDELGGAAAWGFILSAQAAGLVAGGLLMLWLRPRRILLVACAAMLLLLPGMLLLAAAAPWPAIAAAYLLAGVGLEIFGVFWDMSLQQNIPPEKLSRVYSYDALGSFVLIPLGLVAAGPLAAAIGTHETVVLAAGVIAVGTLGMLAVRDVRTLERKPVETDALAATSSP
ncbi:MAG TPA: MFS transporter [Gaiellaceae bacterium]|nr:MFS transporter [Gaiellaceae bacterium]